MKQINLTFKTNRIIEISLILLFFGLVFWMVTLPMRDYDIWFHVKTGEVMAKQGLIYHDVFSYTAFGREWAPYEWLFQVSTYLFQKTFGFWNIKYLISLVVTIQMAVFFLLLKKVFRLNTYLSMGLVFLFIASVYEFFTARPHIFAYTFLVCNLSLIFFYYFKGKNLLYLTLPITILWANLHGSIFLDVGLFFAYSLISLINYYLDKEVDWLRKFKTLGIYGFLTAILTILPPLGFTQYQLLWKFFNLREFISSYIQEWAPLNANYYAFIIYSSTLAVIILLFTATVVLKKSYKKVLWTLPILPFLLLPYMANRNIYLAYITLVLILAWIISEIKLFRGKFYPKYLSLGLIFIILAVNIWLFNFKKEAMAGVRFYYPVHAVEFIKNYNLQGNMFNEYGYGGYLIYQLYPERKVFIDGRTEMYLCCEMPDTLEMSTKKNLPDDEYIKFLNQLWNKYNVSYLLLRTEKHTVLRKVTDILTNDPNWNLVFWDDHSQLFVRRDSKNNHVLKEFENKAATPYSKNPYREGMENEAFSEYERMIKVTDSAKSRNTIGYLLLKQGKLKEAEEQFVIAAQIDPTNESPYMNLAELAANKNQLEEAIKYYEEAQKLAEDRGLIYIRLGQLYIMSRNDYESAKKIWQKGIENTVDTDAKKQLEQLLSSI